MTQIFKYFKDCEIKGLNEKLIQMLDNARSIAGIPFVITSGLRSIEKNREVGGAEDSAHLKGLAVDLKCNYSESRFIIVSALLMAGFKRIGIAPDHIHVDIDKEKSQCIIFLEH